MDRALLSLVFAVLLAVFGVVGTAPALALQAEPHAITVTADTSAVSACADHDLGSQMTSCSPCAAICASATAAILPPSLQSAELDAELESLAVGLAFSDRRTPPAKSPPRL